MIDARLHLSRSGYVLYAQPGHNDDLLVGASVPDEQDRSTVVLWRLDPATGSFATRTLTGVAPGARFLGATADAWVTASSAAGPVTFSSFEGDGSSSLALPDADEVLLAGADGVLFRSRAPSSTPGLDEVRLRLGSPDGATVATVADLGSVATGTDASRPLVLDMTSGSVAWCDPGAAGFWTSDEGGVAVHVPNRCDQVVAVDGGMLVAGTDPSYFGYSARTATSWTASPCPGDPQLVCGLPRSIDGVSDLVRLWPSRTIDGRPAIAGLVSGNAWGAHEWETHWSTWGLADLGLDRTVGPTGYRPARMLHLTATVGRVLAVYVRSDEQRGELARRMDTVLVERRILAAGTAPVSTRAGTEYWTSAAVTPEPLRAPSPVLTASGPYSATTESRGAAQKIVLRRGAAITARVASHGVLASSGPLTFEASSIPGSSADQWRYDLSWMGSDGRRHRLPRPAGGIVTYAIDGQRIAYRDTTGANWLLDVLAPRSGTNPRRITGHLPLRVDYVSPAPTGGLLSGRFLVASRAVLDLTTGRTRRLTGNYHCPAIAGQLLLCVDGGRQVYTLDLSRAGSSYRRIAGLTAYSILPAGASLVTTDDDATWVHQARVTAIPAANGSVGAPRLLGPWAPNGREVSRAFCWKPEWTVTQVLSRWKVALRSPSDRVVRTWTGTAPDGGLGGVRWCPGRAASGDYTWTLTGSGPTGAPVATIGSGRPTGTITVVRPVTARVAVAAPRSVVRGRTTSVTGRLVAASTGAPLPGRTLTLWQRAGSGAWHQVDRGTTSARGAVAFRVRLTATARLRVRLAAEPRTRAAVSSSRLVRVH
ncbi:MAG: hypothetical protein U0S36_15370 [Candidatus Nanopelagicales bacterium]